MGIESDQLVYDYLSRVGDVAQRQQLPSGDRMRLVSSLRNEIDRQRAKFGSDSPAAIRRILGRLGSPDSVVRAASTGGTAAWAEPPPEPSRGPEVPAAPEPLGPERPEPGPAVPEQRSGLVKGPLIPEQATGSQQRPSAFEGPSGPAGPDALAGPDTAAGPGLDWWSVQPGPLGGAPGRNGRSTGVPGFVGGVEIPEILKPPPQEEDEDEDDPKNPENPEKRDGIAVKPGAVEAAVAPAGGFRWLPRLPRRGERERTGGLSHQFLLLAALLLVVGAVLGSWLALGGGWLLAYASRTLSRAEAKWAVFGLPGVSAAGGLVWLWGRLDGRWGQAIPEDGMAEALSGLWPVVVRTAAVTSALYLVWRARRR
ncbi:hypothetical protein ABZ707_10130 [Streptomyces sp. NPDC006923]|uniref:hypothetical protein n=1 Tax=Streptomyces sp. NPDC006923 TaxID=3155355 RepID=UPI0033D23FD9